MRSNLRYHLLYQKYYLYILHAFTEDHSAELHEVTILSQQYDLLPGIQKTKRHLIIQDTGEYSIASTLIFLVLTITVLYLLFFNMEHTKNSTNKLIELYLMEMR